MPLLTKPQKVRIGLRTVKTAVAVVIAMMIVESYGTTTSRIIFAMLGAMAAVGANFKESLESCLTQITGVLFGAAAGVLLLALRLPSMVATGIGIILIITLYNAFRIRFSPSLPCLIVVTICTTPDIQPFTYAVGRIWDTAIGLGTGMLINSLIFPYDNSTQIRFTIESLERDVIAFLEEIFDGDEILPDTVEMNRKILTLAQQMRIFSNQKLLLRLHRQQEEVEAFRLCEGKAHELLAQMEVLCRIGRPGRLTEDNRRRLESCGAHIRDTRQLDAITERDVVTNYHVSQILTLRRELLSALKY